MSEAYSAAYRAIAREAATELGFHLAEGVYAALAGPNYETPAEIRYLRAIGADLVGMSTVPEVIVANHMGMRVLAISCVTNMAAGVLDRRSTTRRCWKPAASARPIYRAAKAVLPRLKG